MMDRPAAILPELLRNLITRPVTRCYPFEPAVVPLGFRGTPRFVAEQCVGCQLCVKDCPSDALHIHVELIPSTAPVIEGQPAPKPTKRYTMELYLDRCVHCARCAEACNKDAISLDTEFELAAFSRDALHQVQG